jgi:ketosteroid isomerase-like protein
MPDTSTLSRADAIRALFAATDAKDTDAKLPYLTDDVRLMFGNADAVKGIDAFREASDTFNASLTSVSHEILSLLVATEEDAAVVELAVTYVRLDGQQLTLPCCNVFRFRDGLVSDYRIYMDIGPVYA